MSDLIPTRTPETVEPGQRVGPSFGDADAGQLLAHRVHQGGDEAVDRFAPLGPGQGASVCGPVSQPQ